MNKNLDELIRGEIAAVKAYDVVLGKITDERERRELSALKEDHARAIQKLKQHSATEVMESSKSAGPWGTFVESFTGGASLFGDKAAMKALRVGEEHGVQEYQELLDSPDVSAEIKNIVGNDILPKQRQHVETVDQLAMAS